MIATTTAAAACARRAALHTAPREYLTFRVGLEEYGMDILQVQEIRSYAEPTRIANAPPCFKGVADLRGVVVPIMDLRLKLGSQTPRDDDRTVIVILNVASRVVGAIVDSVSDVITLSPEQMRPLPEFNARIEGDHLLAIGSVDDRMLILIDIERLMTSTDMGLFDRHESTLLVH